MIFTTIVGPQGMSTWDWACWEGRTGHYIYSSFDEDSQGHWISGVEVWLTHSHTTQQGQNQD